jgi:hypothetical protein
MNADPGKEKVRLWAANPRVVRLPRIANLPRFVPQKFDSYEAFNAWKAELQRELIRKGGARWTR